MNVLGQFFNTGNPFIVAGSDSKDSMFRCEYMTFGASRSMNVE
jgi:hypothetical protein